MHRALKVFLLASFSVTLLMVTAPIAAPAASLSFSVSSSSSSSMMAAIPGFKVLFGGTRPDSLGVKAGRLAPCPATPNCVVSQGAPDADHAIAPLTYSGDAATALARLRQVVAAQPGSEIIEQSETYLYAEFTSRLMGFVDDVEFFLDPAEPGMIQVRSASRLGQSDLGVNRKRIETLRTAFEQAPA